MAQLLHGLSFLVDTEAGLPIILTVQTMRTSLAIESMGIVGIV